MLNECGLLCKQFMIFSTLFLIYQIKNAQDDSIKLNMKLKGNWYSNWLTSLIPQTEVFLGANKELTYKAAVKLLEGEEKTIYHWFYK